jgi:hypothetical protein
MASQIHSKISSNSGVSGVLSCTCDTFVLPQIHYVPRAFRIITEPYNTWNQQNREVTAIVHGSSDPQRIGVVARSSKRIRDRVSFDDFASFVDHSTAAAIDLFSELTPGVELPSTSQPLLRDAG